MDPPGFFIQVDEKFSPERLCGLMSSIVSQSFNSISRILRAVINRFEDFVGHARGKIE